MAQYQYLIQEANNQLTVLLDENDNNFTFTQKKLALSKTAKILSEVPKEEWLQNQELVNLIWAVIDQDMRQRFNFQENTLPRVSEGEDGESTNNHNNLLEHCLALGLLPDRGSSIQETKMACDRYIAERAQGKLYPALAQESLGVRIQNLNINDVQQLYIKRMSETSGDTRIATAAFFAKHLNAEQLSNAGRSHQLTLMALILNESTFPNDYQKLMEIFFQANDEKREVFLDELFKTNMLNTWLDLKKVIALLVYFEKFEANVQRDSVNEETITVYERAKISAIKHMVNYFTNNASLPNAILRAFKDPSFLEQNDLSPYWTQHILNLLSTLVAAQEYEIANDLYVELFAKNGSYYGFVSLPTNITWVPPVLEENADSYTVAQQYANNAIVEIYLEAMLLSVSKSGMSHRFKDATKFVNLLPHLPKDVIKETRSHRTLANNPVKHSAAYSNVLNSTVAQSWKLALNSAQDSLERTTALSDLSTLLIEMSKYSKVRGKSESVSSLFQNLHRWIEHSALPEFPQYKKFYQNIYQIIELQNNYARTGEQEVFAELINNVNELKKLLGSWLNSMVLIPSVEAILVSDPDYVTELTYEIEQKIAEKESAHKAKLTTALLALEQYTNKQDSVRRTDGHRAKRLAHIEQMFDAAQKDNNKEAFNQLRANPPKVEVMGFSLGSGVGSFHTYLPALDYTTWHYFKDDREVQDLVGRILGKQELIKEKQKQQDIAEVNTFINTKLEKLEAQVIRQESAAKISVSEVEIEASVLASWESLVAEVPFRSGILALHPFVGEAKAEKFVATWSANKGAIKENTHVETRVAELKRRSEVLVQRAQSEEGMASEQKTKQRQQESSEIYQKIEAYLIKVRDGKQNISSEAFKERAKWFGELRQVCLDEDTNEIEEHFKQMPRLGVTSELGGYFKRLTASAVYMDWSDEQVSALATLAHTALKQLQQRERDAVETAERERQAKTDEAQRAKEEKKAIAEKMKQEKAAQAQERAKNDAVDYTSKLISGLDSELDTKQARPAEELAKMDISKLQQKIEQLARYFTSNTQRGMTQEKENTTSVGESSTSIVASTSWLSTKSVITAAMQTHAGLICENVEMANAVDALKEKMVELSNAIEEAKKSVAEAARRAEAEAEAGRFHLDALGQVVGQRPQLSAQGAEANKLYTTFGMNL